MGVFGIKEWARRRTTRARHVKDAARTARTDPPSIQVGTVDMPAVKGHRLEREPVLLLQVVDAAGAPDNVLVTVAVLGTICVTVVVT